MRPDDANAGGLRHRAAGTALPASARACLARYFPELDLGAVWLHHGIPRYVRGRPGAYVNRNRIYLASRPHQDDDPEWLALLAHELTHVRQYRELGAWRFRLAYLGEYLAGRLRLQGHDAAYRSISFERSARAIEARVRSDLRAQAAAPSRSSSAT